ncbi:hypothetical protein AHAS_Ahas16G0230100 [Arachis hypogaea]
MWLDECLGKSRGSFNPIISLCCMEGKVELPFLKHPPQTLQELHSGTEKKSKYFLKNIRAFNGMFAFPSMAGKVDHSINKGGAPPIFCIGGQNCHRIGSLLPLESKKPKFAQLYIYDTENEITNRMESFR